jgi:hypothetical protein
MAHVTPMTMAAIKLKKMQQQYAGLQDLAMLCT